MYQITSGDDNNDFLISENGTISTNKLLDREAQAIYSMVVTATDQASLLQQRLSSTVQVLKVMPLSITLC